MQEKVKESDVLEPLDISLHSHPEEEQSSSSANLGRRGLPFLLEFRTLVVPARSLWNASPAVLSSRSTFAATSNSQY